MPHAWDSFTQMFSFYKVSLMCIFTNICRSCNNLIFSLIHVKTLHWFYLSLVDLHLLKSYVFDWKWPHRIFVLKTADRNSDMTARNLSSIKGEGLTSLHSASTT